MTAQAAGVQVTWVQSDARAFEGGSLFRRGDLPVRGRVWAGGHG